MGVQFGPQVIVGSLTPALRSGVFVRLLQGRKVVHPGAGILNYHDGLHLHPCPRLH